MIFEKYPKSHLTTLSQFAKHKKIRNKRIEELADSQLSRSLPWFPYTIVLSETGKTFGEREYFFQPTPLLDDQIDRTEERGDLHVLVEAYDLNYDLNNPKLPLTNTSKNVRIADSIPFESNIPLLDTITFDLIVTLSTLPYSLNQNDVYSTLKKHLLSSPHLLNDTTNQPQEFQLTEGGNQYHHTGAVPQDRFISVGRRLVTHYKNLLNELNEFEGGVNFTTIKLPDDKPLTSFFDNIPYSRI